MTILDQVSHFFQKVLCVCLLSKDYEVNFCIDDQRSTKLFLSWRLFTVLEICHMQKCTAYNFRQNVTNWAMAKLCTNETHQY